MPEFPYDIDAVCDAVRTRNARGKKFSIVVVGEGSKALGGDIVVKRRIENSPDTLRLGGVSNQVAAQIEGLTNIECRVTILGHLLRGGTPSATDRLLATRFGVAAASLAAESGFGKMVVLKDNRMDTVAIEDVAGKLRLVLPDDPLVKAAQAIGICLGHSSEAALREHHQEKVST